MNTAIYTRISEDDEQQGKGVARQAKDCRSLITRLGWKGEVKLYEENDTSATRSKVRPVFERLMADARSGDVNAIVFWDSDRITRSPREAEDVIDLVEKHGVKVIGFHGDDLTSDDGQMMFRIKITVAKNEIDKMRRRIKAASDQRAAEGQMSGQTGYGFNRREDGSIETVPDEVAVIREAVRRILDGDTLRGVCTDFNARGISSPGRGKLAGRPWNSTTLKQLVLRESLAGLRRHRGVVVGELHESIPRILTRDEHERLKALLHDPLRRSSPAGRAPKYLLGGIARCGRCDGTLDEAGQPVECGGVMVRAVGRMTTTKSGTKRQPPSYTCSECYRVRRKQADVDEVVERIVIGRLQMPDAARFFTQGDPAALQEARDSMEAIDARLANAADMFAAGTIEAAQLVRITEGLRADRAQAAAAVDAALPAAIPADLIGPRAAEVWEGLSMDVKRAVLSTLVTVTILPSGSGKVFDPETVCVTWRS